MRESWKGELSPAQYEAIGRAAIGFMNGRILGQDVSVEEYVQRAPTEAQGNVREVLEEVIVPLSKLRDTEDEE